MADEMYDVAIIGGGPAGQQAAIHAVRKKVKTVVLSRPGGSALEKAHVENYWAVDYATGADLLKTGLAQCAKFGAEIAAEDVIGIETPDENAWRVTTETAQVFAARSVIIATGSRRERLGVTGERELLGKGVSYCAECDAFFYRGKRVVVIGGGSAAVSGALVLAKTAGKVVLIAEKLDCPAELANRLREHAVEVREGVAVTAILGKDAVTGVALGDGGAIETDGVFIELGAKGAVNMATMIGVNLDAGTMRHIVTDKRQRTNVPGIFAAGDICGPPLQLAKAVGEGCVAGTNAAEFAKTGQTAKEYWEDMCGNPCLSSKE